MIYIPFIAFWFACVTGVPQKFRNAFKKDRLRPFDCTKCMAFWLALIHELFAGFTHESILLIPICSLAGWLIESVAIKIKLPINV